jgi:hypothetical protein
MWDGVARQRTPQLRPAGRHFKPAHLCVREFAGLAAGRPQRSQRAPTAAAASCSLVSHAVPLIGALRHRTVALHRPLRHLLAHAQVSGSQWRLSARLSTSCRALPWWRAAAATGERRSGLAQDSRVTHCRCRRRCLRQPNRSLRCPTPIVLPVKSLDALHLHCSLQICRHTFPSAVSLPAA